MDNYKKVVTLLAIKTGVVTDKFKWEKYAVCYIKSVELAKHFLQENFSEINWDKTSVTETSRSEFMGTFAGDRDVETLEATIVFNNGSEYSVGAKLNFSQIAKFMAELLDTNIDDEFEKLTNTR